MSSEASSIPVDDWVRLAYAELRSIAARYLSRERRGHALQPTALVHEAFLRLRDLERITLDGRTHFLTVAAGQMRRILVEYARMAGAGKRGGGLARVTLGDQDGAVTLNPETLLTIDRSLERLAARFPRSARVAEMKLFAGMTTEEIASAHGVTDRTIKSDWRFARAWLARDLGVDEKERP